MIINLDNKTYDYQPYKDGLYKMRMLMRYRADKSFRNVFRYNITSAFHKTILDTINPNDKFAQNRNILMSISGQTGSGKSLMVMTLGVKYFPKFTHRNVFFFDQQILDNVDKFPPNTLLVRDENPGGAIFGAGSQRITSQIGLLSEVSRKAGLNLAFIEPSFSENPIIKVYLETVDFDLNNRITRMAIRDSQTLNYMGAFYIRVLAEDHPEFVAYNKHKDAFIDQVKKGKLGESKQDYDSMVDNLLKKLDASYRTKKERKVFIIKEHPSLTNTEIDILATLLEIRLRES
jgi:hypothetical protein